MTRPRGLLAALLLLFSVALLPEAAGGAPSTEKLDGDLARLAERGGSEKVRVVVETSGGRAGPRGAVAAFGGAVEGEHAHLVQASVPAVALRALAARDDVRYVRRPLRFIPLGVPGEGIAATNASAWHASGWEGAGVKVAVIDLGFAGYTLRQASGDLPASLRTNTEFCGTEFASGERHGTAVAEIVHEMAPEAELFLICIRSEVDLGRAAEYVKRNGIDVVNFSVGTFNSSRGDGSGGPGTPDAVVADLRSGGVLWVNSAGNQAQQHWSGAFSDLDRDRFHEFAGGQEVNTVVVPRKEGGVPGSVCAYLKWDEWAAPTSDFDLHLGNVRSSDPTVSTPTDDLCFENTTTAPQLASIRIERLRGSGAPRLDLFVVGGSALDYRVLEGSLPEPASSPAALAVGAICWQGDALASYSSRGPTISSATNPAGFTKPDLAAPDSVSSATYGLFSSCGGSPGFSGTSASAPHVAGAAALAAQASPQSGPAALQSWLEQRAGDLGATGKDNSYGWGKLSLGSPPAGAPFPPPPPQPPPPPPAARADVTPPTAPSLRAPATALQRRFPVAWRASDGETGVATYRVRYRRAGIGTVFGSRLSWTTTRATSDVFPGAPGYTYCFSAQATDVAGNTSAWSAERCSAVPLDDRALTRRGGWARRTGSGYYLATYTVSRTRGAALVRNGIRAKRLALVATRCAGCGTVKVLWNGRLLRTIDLRSATTRKRQLVNVARFGSVRSGTLKIVVASARRPVKIEGVAASKT